MTSTAIDSRAARWSVVLAPVTANGACPESESASLVARAGLVAGAAALQARVAERRGEDARARLRRIATVGAVAAAGSLVCAVVALVPAVASDLIAPEVGWAASAVAVLLGLVPAVLLAMPAAGRPVADEAPPAAMASAMTLATLGAAFGRAIADIDADAHPDVTRAVGVLLSLLESEAGTAARSGRSQAAAPARRHRRIVPIERRVVVRTADGRKLIGTIADVSLSGVALTASLPRVSVGDAAMVGTRPAVVARLWERGMAFQFDDELDTAAFDEGIVL